MSVVIDGSLVNPDYPRVCYNNLSAAAAITASSEATDFDKENVQDGLTSTFWKPTSQDSYLEFDMGSATTIDYIGIAGHNCGTQGNTINIQYWDGASWQTIDTITPTDDSVILFLFESQNRQIFKIEFTGGSVPSVASIFMGVQLVMERQLYGGHTPIIFAKQHVIRPNISETGQYLGRSVVREGAFLRADFPNLTAAWVRTNILPFIEDAVDNPFFFAWRPTSYPDEVCYCWTDGDLSASNMGQRDLMQFSINANAKLL
ncbi:MAG: discoidin domain-containing protein [Rickettsiales bacterium]|nr:discoidin domain-containing protein [Pseudomonadota bacterium]MDA0966887.1 discoidin domain-containing protein [Pseudomonadota bacterium]MDG4543562.1 discoidin domain-containing protein [Rickettsiales bacterium]MDG4545710.1 discoidin domain-containing protein [Rickettsiales bacterium]MDG4547517.1 discoidin domain-containing protein [Rickettsiales bacterium]